jgi:SAM-dependent methyltransferase
MPPARDERHARYSEVYDDIARADLETSLEHTAVRQARHVSLRRFVGDVRGARVLDIGSSHAALLQALDAQVKVAFDIALPYLREIGGDAGIHRVRGDAEALPFRPGAFDVIVLTDVLEHVLEPERVVNGIRRIATPDTRVIVEVPWQEDLSSYENAPWEFTHLRSFDMLGFVQLWAGFVIRRRRGTTPKLDVPPLFNSRWVPSRLLGFLTAWYTNDGVLVAREWDWRQRTLRALPRRERLLLLIYPPLVQQFELRLYQGSTAQRFVRLLEQWRRRRPRRRAARP